MIKTNADEIRAEFAPLYSRYSGQVNPQPAHIEINPEQQGMVAEFNPEIGNAVPMNVWHGRAYRVSISPYYTGKQVAEILENVDFQNMVQRVFDGYSCAYDGSNHNGRLTDDAKAALEEMERFLQEMDQYLNVSDSGVSVYAPEDWFSELPDLAGKSDEELSLLADQFRTEAESDNVCIDGDILRFLKDRRGMIKIKVTGSQWVDGSGWSYTEDLDPMEVDSIDEAKEAAKSYAAEFAKSYTPSAGTDYEIRFYGPDDEYMDNPLAKFWVSEAK